MSLVEKIKYKIVVYELQSNSKSDNYLACEKKTLSNNEKNYQQCISAILEKLLPTIILDLVIVISPIKVNVIRKLNTLAGG